MDSSSNMALVKLMEAMSIQIGNLTKEVGELRGMLSAWELDRERIRQQRDDMHEIRDRLNNRVSAESKSLAESMSLLDGKMEGIKTRQMTTAIAVIVIGVISLGNQWPVIIKLLA